MKYLKLELLVGHSLTINVQCPLQNYRKKYIVHDYLKNNSNS